MSKLKRRAVKILAVTGFLLTLLFPFFLPDSPQAATEPSTDDTAVIIAQSAADSIKTGQAAAPVQSRPAADTAETDGVFPVEKLLIFSGLLIIVVVAFLKWGMGTAEKTTAPENKK
ncbi:MAG: hypothetical protein JW904_12320 [Spirochaetales bacterium]|nr:hypothetical protein [Spirochaetales bacterium]